MRSRYKLNGTDYSGSCSNGSCSLPFQIYKATAVFYVPKRNYCLDCLKTPVWTKERRLYCDFWGSTFGGLFGSHELPICLRLQKKSERSGQVAIPPRQKGTLTDFWISSRKLECLRRVRFRTLDTMPKPVRVTCKCWHGGKFPNTQVMSLFYTLLTSLAKCNFRKLMAGPFPRLRGPALLSSTFSQPAVGR